ncbi:MAG: SpoVG family protein [Planctomycetaceae bacterium]|nr:SpoVG family protein [Planctomycetaceae bacterium]
MEMTDIRIDMSEDQSRVLAYATITLDNCFAVHDLKVTQHATRGLFVAMPARTITVRCPNCHGKVTVNDHFCTNCGTQLPEDLIPENRSHYADIARPVTPECRAKIEDRGSGR